MSWKKSATLNPYIVSGEYAPLLAFEAFDKVKIWGVQDPNLVTAPDTRKHIYYSARCSKNLPDYLRTGGYEADSKHKAAEFKPTASRLTISGESTQEPARNPDALAKVAVRWGYEGSSDITTALDNARASSGDAFNQIYHVDTPELTDPVQSREHRVVVPATYPEPSWGRWATTSPCTITSTGGSSKEDPLRFTEDFAIIFKFKYLAIPEYDACLMSIGENIQVWWDGVANTLATTVRFTRALEAAPTARHEFVTVGWSADGFTRGQQYICSVSWSKVDNKLVTIAIPLPENSNALELATVRAPWAVATYGTTKDAPAGSSVHYETNVHEPITFMNDWEFKRPMLTVAGSTAILLNCACIIKGLGEPLTASTTMKYLLQQFESTERVSPSSDITASVDGLSAAALKRTIFYRFTAASLQHGGALVNRVADSKGNGPELICDKVRFFTPWTASYIFPDTSGLSVSPEFMASPGEHGAGCYGAAHMPEHRYKMFYVADNGKGQRSIAVATSTDLVLWSLQPRARPVFTVDGYYAASDYQDGTATEPKATAVNAIENAAAILTTDGRLIIYFDQETDPATPNATRIRYLDMGHHGSKPGWTHKYRLEKARGASRYIGPERSLITSIGFTTGDTTVGVGTAMSGRGTPAAGDGTFDSLGVKIGSIFYDARRGSYKLWYRGISHAAAPVWQGGWASSSDVFEFNKTQNRSDTIHLEAGVESDAATYAIRGISRELLTLKSNNDTKILYTVETGVANQYAIYLAESNIEETIHDDAPYSPSDEDWDILNEIGRDSAANRIVGIHRNYVMGDTPEQKLLVACGSGIYEGTDSTEEDDYLKGEFDLVWNKQTFHPTLGGFDHFFVNDGINCYITNGADPNLWWNGVQMRHYAPADMLTGTAPVGSVANLGNSLPPNTVFRYRISAYRDDDGYEGDTSNYVELATGAGDDTAYVRMTEAQQTLLDTVNTGFDYFRVYGATESSPYYLASHIELAAKTVATIKSVTYFAQAREPVWSLPAYRHLRMNKYHGVMFYSYLPGADQSFGISQGQGVVFFNSILDEKRIDTGNFFDFAAEGGGAIVSILPCNDYLLVLCERAIFVIYGYANTGFQWRRLSATLGCIGPRAATTLGGDIVFLSRSGLFITNGEPEQFKLLSHKVKSVLDGISQNRFSRCVVSSHEDKVYIYFPKGSNINNTCLVLNMSTGVWTERTNQYISCTEECNSETDEGELLGGDSRYGYVYNLEHGESDDGEPIECQFETGDLALTGAPEWDVQPRRVYIDCVGTQGIADFSIIADRQFRDWKGGFDVSSISFVRASDFGMRGGPLVTPIKNTKTAREESVSPGTVGRNHRVACAFSSDIGSFEFNGVTIMSRGLRRR